MVKILLLLLQVLFAIACPVLDLSPWVGLVYLFALCGWWIMTDEIGWMLCAMLVFGITLPVNQPEFDERISSALNIAAFDCRGEYYYGSDTITVSGKGKNQVTIAVGDQILHAGVVGVTLLLETGDTLYCKRTSCFNPDTTEYENMIRATRILGKLKDNQVFWEKSYKERYDEPIDSGLGG
ncbi:MAG: hypothetical protein JNJ57_13400 [Saprospiraceae bacterium]|nr:hypothetical protein [Saprospiraceae bacterium]